MPSQCNSWWINFSFYFCLPLFYEALTLKNITVERFCFSYWKINRISVADFVFILQKKTEWKNLVYLSYPKHLVHSLSLCPLSWLRILIWIYWIHSLFTSTSDFLSNQFYKWYRFLRSEFIFSKQWSVHFWEFVFFLKI